MSPGPKRVLFVCFGNACRSQMAEAFARTYGSDVIIPASAGMHPAARLGLDTVRAMDEKNIDIRDHFPKAIRHLGRAQFDLVINMSGQPLPESLGPNVLAWDVPDPILVGYEEHCQIRDQIERMVMQLVVDLRRDEREPSLRPDGM